MCSLMIAFYFQALYDLYVLILLLINTMEMPRLSDRMLLEIALKDGIFLVFVSPLFCRMLCFLACS